MAKLVWGEVQEYRASISRTALDLPGSHHWLERKGSARYMPGAATTFTLIRVNCNMAAHMPPYPPHPGAHLPSVYSDNQCDSIYESQPCTQDYVSEVCNDEIRCRGAYLRHKSANFVAVCLWVRMLDLTNGFSQVINNSHGFLEAKM